jgi:hypothetical protein
MKEEEALIVAKRYVKENVSDEKTEFLVVEEETIPTEFGWIFFYNTREYVEDGDVMAIAVGNAPLLVDKVTGKLHVTGTAKPIDYYIDAYRKCGTCHPEKVPQ